jgi:hypothetical protein
MTSPKDSSADSAIRNLDLTLELEIPLPGASGSCSSSPEISLGPVKVPLGTSTREGPISGTFTKEQIEVPDSETGRLP